MKLYLLNVLFLIGINVGIAQKLPMDEKTGEVVYTDLVLFDTLTPDTAFLQMLNYVRSDSIRNKNIQANSDRSLITFTTVSSAYSEFPDRFGEILCDVVIKYFPNKFAYRITNFRHVPLDDFPPCTNNLNVVRPKCFEGKPYEKYWGNVKECAISSMNDFIIKLLYVSLENQPTTKTLKMDDYFLWRNRG